MSKNVLINTKRSNIKNKETSISTQKQDDLEQAPSYKIDIKVNNLIKFGDNTISFEDYKNNLPIFNISKKEINQKNIKIEDGIIKYSYLEDSKIENKEIKNFKFSLDYRTNRKEDGKDIIDDLKEILIDYKGFVDTLKNSKIINDFCSKNNFLLSSKNGGENEFSFFDIFPFIDSIFYDNLILVEDLDKLSLEGLILRLLNDFLVKLKNKINLQINSRKIVFGKNFKQRKNGVGSDFIENYTITKKFKSEEERIEYINNFEDEKIRLIDKLGFKETFNFKKSLFQENKECLDAYISLNRLNEGKIKFIKSISKNIQETINSLSSKDKERYEFYLMRNVESLRSIGVYLEDEEMLYFHDFIFWIIDNEKKMIFLNLIDPKGQDGIKNNFTGNFDSKAIIGNKEIDKTQTLKKLEEGLNKNISALDSKFSDYKIKVNSFILLVDSDNSGIEGDLEKMAELIENHIYSLNWTGNNSFYNLILKELSNDGLDNLLKSFEDFYEINKQKLKIIKEKKDKENQEEVKNENLN